MASNSDPEIPEAQIENQSVSIDTVSEFSSWDDSPVQDFGVATSSDECITQPIDSVKVDKEESMSKNLENKTYGLAANVVLDKSVASLDVLRNTEFYRNTFKDLAPENLRLFATASAILFPWSKPLEV